MQVRIHPAERQQFGVGALFHQATAIEDQHLVCVFDGTDRIQHMFWRYLDPDHPAARYNLALVQLERDEYDEAITLGTAEPSDERRLAPRLPPHYPG